ncbi:MAG: DeoR/GlpR transcriptional regulator, partial [Lachnospiraceae bacterium]|nr:DeoR/GlpR transcriptional regulator [Lachnospiraceae bacterium]
IRLTLPHQRHPPVLPPDPPLPTSIILDASSTLLVTGGVRKTDFGVLTGSLVLNFIRELRLNKAFLTADSVDISFGVSNASFDEVDIKKELIRSSRYVYLAADHSKFGKAAMTHVCSLHDIDEIITDDGLSVDMQKELSADNIAFTLVSPETED